MKFLWQSLALALLIFAVLDLLITRLLNPKNTLYVECETWRGK